MSDPRYEPIKTPLFGLPRTKVLRFAAWMEVFAALIFALFALYNVEGAQLIFGVVAVMLLFSSVMLFLVSSREAEKERERAAREGFTE